MPPNEKTSAAGLVPICLFGLLLLSIVYCAPDAGCGHGKTFIAVARFSTWRQFAEWPAAWCSFKIILFSLGTFFFCHGLFGIFSFWTNIKLDWLTLLLPVIAAIGTWLGVYYLLKAVF